MVDYPATPACWILISGDAALVDCRNKTSYLTISSYSKGIQCIAFNAKNHKKNFDFVDLDAGLNYVRGMRMDSPTDDKDLYRIAPLNGRTQLTFEKSGWMGAIEGVFVADQGDVIGYRDGSNTNSNELKTKGYMLMNLRGKYEPYPGVVIGKGIENVLDSKHFNHLGGYQFHNRSNGRVALPGRNVYATLSYSW